mmetsp:Transcript_105346/g.307965  ORF Transcript_105346/g.307965 Transcript_105346/m.307965 type:complete len:210 (-) Transcript_105346:1619-2248(-)
MIEGTDLVSPARPLLLHGAIQDLAELQLRSPRLSTERVSKRRASDQGRGVHARRRQPLQHLPVAKLGHRLTDGPAACRPLCIRASAGPRLIGERAQLLRLRAAGRQHPARLLREGRGLPRAGSRPNVCVHDDHQCPTEQEEGAHDAQEPDPSNAKGATHIVHPLVGGNEAVSHEEEKRAPKCCTEAAECFNAATIDCMASEDTCCKKYP